ncbi:MAG: hypothetical protein K0Q66_2146 [Chitinophagaceae bacterium]|jgi:hypothetical protein|nr:hypothetical protein [Chitinophagaceae bacterium]
MANKDNNLSIGRLTSEYLELNRELIDAINEDRSLSEREALTERIRTILRTIEELEARRSAKS